MHFSQSFLTYYRTCFSTEGEFRDFLASLEKNLPRTLRVHPGADAGVRERLGKLGWKLEPTSLPHVFSIAHSDTFDPFERRIGFSLDHLVGNFYIQELAASTAVSVLSEGRVSRDHFQILDVAASPGGKTTQLAEYYPESFIIANEPSRTRIPQLLQNLDRMGSANIGVTLYMGQYFGNFPETFDRILLDAPCSGDGTMYKGTESGKYWHLKNIRAIANLQKRLIESAYRALKVGGEMVYSTCAMNEYEDENVRDHVQTFSGESIEILYEKKFWPHHDNTGGFYILKLRKTRSFGVNDTARKYVTNTLLEPFHGNIAPWKLRPGYVLYRHREKILVVHASVPVDLLERYYFMRLGDILGTFHSGKLTPYVWAYRYLDMDDVSRVSLTTEHELDIYLRGAMIPSVGKDEYVLLEHTGVPFALEKRQSNMLSQSFPREWQRK